MSSSSSSPYTANKFVSTTQTIGVWTAGFQLSCALILGLLFMGVGLYYVVNNPNKNSIPVDATVTASNCTPYQMRNSSSTTYSCNLTISYPINGTSYSSNINTNNNINYNVGQTIKVRVDKNNYQNAQLDNGISNPGSSMLCCGITIISIAALHFWAVRKFPWYATLTGIETGLDII